MSELREKHAAMLELIGNELRRTCNSSGEDCDICQAQREALEHAAAELRRPAPAVETGSDWTAEFIHDLYAVASAEGMTPVDLADWASYRLKAHPPTAPRTSSFQSRVQPWLMECFSMEVCRDKRERCDRFIEEALELVQSIGYDLRRVAALVEYTGNRPAGEPSQEVGGVMVTLAALCGACDLDMHEAGEVELARILQPEVTERIRQKQAAKARDIPFLPLPTTPRAAMKRGE